MPGPVYWDYLELPKLLALQGGVEKDETAHVPDELHFIVVHQVFELWFKLVLRELRLARDHLAEPKVPEETIPYVVHHMRRVNAVLALAVEQFKVMETLTPQDFLGFRDKLSPASGFQSFQMREMEILLGLTTEERVAYGSTDAIAHLRQMAEASPTGAFVTARIDQVLGEKTLRQAMHDWLYRTPIHGSGPSDPDDAPVVREFLEDYLRAIEAHQDEQAQSFGRTHGIDHKAVVARFAENTAQARRFLFAEDQPDERQGTVRRIRAALLFIESYRELPLLAWPRTLIDGAVELEEHLVLFRSRHARMVERVIGRRVGTGGSSGVDYLDATTKMRIFGELWAVRTLLLPKSRVPDLKHPELYGYAAR